MNRIRRARLCALFCVAACGPQIGDLEKGETGTEIDAPRGEADYAGQSQGELEALALHRPVQLAYGGQRRWTPRPRPGETETPRATAIAHARMNVVYGGGEAIARSTQRQHQSERLRPT